MIKISESHEYSIDLDSSWKVVDTRKDGRAFRSNSYGFMVICSISSKKHDNKYWLHISISRFDKSLPTHNDLKIVKKYFVGKERTAIQIFPPENKHIDIGGSYGLEILHLWSCLDGNPLPDFTDGGDSI